MKKLTKVLAATILSFSAVAANAADVVPADEQVSSELCAVATQGNKFKMRDAIEASKLDKQFIVENVKCNDQDFVSFVAQHGVKSDAMINMLVPATRNSDVTITDLASVSSY